MQAVEMGCIEGTFEERLITAGEVAHHLLKTCASLREFASFMFGSSLLGAGSDYDVLIVGPDGEPLARLKVEIELAGKELPLDILYMLPTEAEETGFVLEQGCVPLSELANSDKT